MKSVLVQWAGWAVHQHCAAYQALLPHPRCESPLVDKMGILTWACVHSMLIPSPFYGLGTHDGRAKILYRTPVRCSERSGLPWRPVDMCSGGNLLDIDHADWAAGANHGPEGYPVIV